MTELEKMERARMYIEKLANGIDPLSDQPVRDDDIVNNVRISRCMFYVAEVLGQVIEAGGEIRRKKKRAVFAFELPLEKRAEIELSETPVKVTEITQRINDLIDSSEMKKLKSQSITGWLVGAGLLTEITLGGKRQKIPTHEGERIGIIAEKRMGSAGYEYMSVAYPKAVQKLIIDNIDAIAELN